MTQRRKVPADPAAALKAAKADAAVKAERNPRTLTATEVGLLPGKKILELGNAGHLQHLGVGGKPVKPATPAVDAPKGTSKAAQRGSQTAKVTRTSRARTGRRK